MKTKFRLPVKARCFLYTLLAVVLLQSCVEYGQDYKYTYTAKVTYQNGDIDTLAFGRESFKGNKVYVYLKTEGSGVLSNAGTSPCLVVGCGFYKETIACGIRKYEILSESKEPISNNR